MVVGHLTNFRKTGKFPNLYDGSKLIKAEGYVKLHKFTSEDNDALIYVADEKTLNTHHNQYVFRYPYYIRKVFNL